MGNVIGDIKVLCMICDPDPWYQPLNLFLDTDRCSLSVVLIRLIRYSLPWSQSLILISLQDPDHWPWDDIYRLKENPLLVVNYPLKPYPHFLFPPTSIRSLFTPSYIFRSIFPVLSIPHPYIFSFPIPITAAQARPFGTAWGREGPR